MNINEFVWDDKTVLEFVNYTLNEAPTLSGRYSDLDRFKDKFKASKQSVSLDWEIIAVKNKGNGSVTFWAGGRPYKLNEVDFKNESIYSVCRKSDNIVFQLGNEVRISNTSGSLVGIGKITEFQIFKDRMNVIFMSDAQNFYTYSLEQVSHATAPLKESKPLFFKTFDGVELYDRSHEVFAIEKGKYEIFNAYSGKSIGTWINGWYTTEWLRNPNEHDTRIIPLLTEHYLIFSTKDAAENWILLNKPVLSVAEVMNLPNTKFVEHLKELAKSKL